MKPPKRPQRITYIALTDDYAYGWDKSIRLPVRERWKNAGKPSIYLPISFYLRFRGCGSSLTCVPSHQYR